MWSKEEARNRKVRFYTNFGVYMKKHVENYDQKIHWVNYRTGVSSVFFKIESDNKTARVCIDIINKDEGLRDLFFEQFQEFKTLLQSEMDELIWLKEYYNKTGQINCRIYVETSEFSMNNEAQWGDLYRFFEKNMIALHEFWDNSKDIFIDLEN